MVNEEQKNIESIVNSGFNLSSVINNDNMFTSIRQHDVSKVRCIKLEDGIEFMKMDTRQSFKIPYEQCKDFAMAVLESFCDFTMCGETSINVDVKCNGKNKA